MTVIAIHQPNFFPWLGYFDKICNADTFIFLDDVQFPKKGGSWSNRVKLLLNGEGRWLTAPVDRRFHGTRNVNEMFFSNTEDWRKKILKTLISNYKRAKYFNETYSIIEPLVKYPDDNLMKFNIHAIKALSSALGYKTTSLLISSELHTQFSATDRLIELTKLVGGKKYFCGGGAMGYQQDDAFEKAGIVLLYQNFVCPTYSQFERQNFISGLSIIDALMNLGLNGVRDLLIKNV